MSTSAKLIEKLQKLNKEIKKRVRGGYDRVDLREEVIAANPNMLALLRGHQRRLDDDLQVDVAASEPALAVELLASTFDRHDFGGSDFGVRMVLSSGLVEALGLQPGDMVEVREGEYAGRVLEIQQVDDVLDELRFADDVGKSNESDISATARISSLS